jgi:DNL zinc finger
MVPTSTFRRTVTQCSIRNNSSSKIGASSSRRNCSRSNCSGHHYRYFSYQHLFSTMNSMVPMLSSSSRSFQCSRQVNEIRRLCSNMKSAAANLPNVFYNTWEICHGNHIRYNRLQWKERTLWFSSSSLDQNNAAAVVTTTSGVDDVSSALTTNTTTFEVMDDTQTNHINEDDDDENNKHIQLISREDVVDPTGTQGEIIQTMNTNDATIEIIIHVPEQITIPGAEKGGKKLAIVYTCTICNTRSMKQFTERAYNHGVVIVKCPTCQNQHLIADRIGYFPEAHDPETDSGFDLTTVAKQYGASYKRITATTEVDNDTATSTATGTSATTTLSMEDWIGSDKMKELRLTAVQQIDTASKDESK